MSEEDLRLRPAVLSDAYALWLWANDPDTRMASYDRPLIEWQEHVAWVRARLASSEAVVLIAEKRSGQPIGSSRFDTADGWRVATLSYVIAPEARGQGWSRPMLALATTWIHAHKRPASIVADVLDHNDRSLGVFRALGWAETGAVRPGVRRFERGLDVEEKK